MSSYAALCRKAGLPPPTGLADFNVPPPNGYAPAPRESAQQAIGRGMAREARQKAGLKVELDRMVARGELFVDAEGRYGLPEWKKKA